MKARFFAIAALVLGLASCQKDFAPEANSAGEVNVTLSVSTPELIGATRAGLNGEVDGQGALDSRFGAIDYLDGNVANDSRWDWNDVDIRYTMEVYDAENLEKPIKDRQEIIKDQYQQVEFEVRLIPNRKYQFVVFADFVDQATKEPLRHVIGETLNDIALVNEALNDEVADCYFKSWTFEPTNNTSNQTEATLTRPYAKVRVIATDLAELNLNVHPESIDIEYNTVIPTAFNAVKGSISGDNTTKTFSYNYIAEIRDNMADHVYNADYDAMVDAKGRASHMTLFTDYILAKDEQSPINFKMTVKDAIKEIKIVDFNTEIPVQRNYLTTIVGNVLTTETDVEIKIDDSFDGFKNYDADNNTLAETIVINDYEELEEALKVENLIEGTNTFKFATDIVGNIFVPEVAGKAVIIDGNGFKYDGCIVLNGGSSYNGEGTVIENVNFETSDNTKLQGDAFIYCADQNGNNRYPDNLVVRNCTFTATGAAVDNAVGIKLRSLGNSANPRSLNIEGCSADGVHSMVQLLSCGSADVCIDGVTITNAKNGISLEKTGKVVIRNSNISAKAYGVRADGCAANTTIENTTIAAAQPVIVRKVKTNGYVLSFAGENTLTPTTEGDYQVIFTNDSDDVDYAFPTGTYTLVDGDKFKAYPRNIVDGIKYDVETKSFNISTPAEVASFAAGVSNGYDFAGRTVALEGNVDLAGQNWTPAGTEENQFRGTFDGKDYTISNLTIDGGDNIAMFAYVGDNVTIKNLTLENIDVKGGSYVAGLVCNAGENLVVENVTVSGNVEATGYAAAINFYATSIKLANCENYATVSGNRGAGLVAWIDGAASVLENVANYGDITGNISAAGISNRIAGTVKNAVNHGAIKGMSTEASAGISGTATAATTFEYCYNYGNVTTTADNANASAAGILGQTPSKAATFNYCANFGAITAEQSYAAGIGYSLYGNVTANYCYNAGAISGAKAAGAIAPKAQYGANDTAKYCLNAGEITSAKKVYQGSNKNTSCYYYNNGVLYNVADNTVADADAALATLNGGADADFFVEENGVIVVK